MVCDGSISGSGRSRSRRSAPSRQADAGELRETPPAAPRTVVFGFLDLGEGGAQRLTLATCAALDRRRFRPVLLCARGDGSLVEPARALGLPVRALGRLRRPFDLAAVPLLAEALRELEADIVHVPLYSRASPYLRLAARLAGVPLVVVEDWSLPAKLPALRRSADRLLRGGARFVAASRAQERDLLRSGVPALAIAVVHAGVDVARFGSGARSAARAAFGLAADIPIALVPARLVPAKGHDDLLSALPAVLAHEPRLQLLFAGQGPLAGALASRLRSEGLERSVRLLGQVEDMSELYAAADFVVLPSRIEGLPSVLLEAFAARRAVVATDVGGVAEALTDGDEGRLVPAGDRAALAAAVADLATDSVLRERMAERGRARVERDFRLDQATLRLEAVYERWLAAAERRLDRAC
ncbi:MAG: glycosyltransferase [Thermoanaerobaculia bacterium]